MFNTHSHRLHSLHLPGGCIPCTAHSYNKPFMLSPLRSPLSTMPATHISTHTHKYTCVNLVLCLWGLSWGPAVTTWEWGPADRRCVREQLAVKAHSNTCIQRHVYKRQQRCCAGPAGATCRENRKWDPWMYEVLGIGCHVSSQVLSSGKCLKKQDAVPSSLTVKSFCWRFTFLLFKIKSGKPGLSKLPSPLLLLLSPYFTVKFDWNMDKSQYLISYQ